jgi:bloom syndrome protein
MNRPEPARSRTQPQSTMFTSPIQAPKRRINNTTKDSREPEQDESDGYTSDDAFEPLKTRTAVNKRNNQHLGPPITSDNMTGLSQIRANCVNTFVDNAQKLDEKLRNKNSLRDPLFTTSEYRQMAINWTLTTRQMINIGLNTDKAIRWGPKFFPALKAAQADYEAVVHFSAEVDMDANHQNVIDLCSDGDGDEDEFQDGIDLDDFDDNDDDNVSPGEEPSKYFSTAKAAEFNARLAQVQALPKSYQPKRDASDKPSRGGSGSRGKFRGGRKTYPRRSEGSNSAGGGGSSRSGVSKRGQNRKASTGSRRTTSTRGGGSTNGSLMSHFGNRNAGGGGGGGGIGAMPT